MTENGHSSLGIHHQPSTGVRRLRLLKKGRRGALLAACVLGLTAAGVMLQRAASARTLAETTRVQAQRNVTLVLPQRVSGSAGLRLPGTLQGLAETPIYTRSSGFLAAWYKDIGDTVRAGDVLARVATPEAAQQLVEAEAAHAQAVANLKLAQSSAERWEGLRKQDAVSQQEFEERRNARAVAVAVEASSKATVSRLASQLDYNRIVAPFAGVVTQRSVEVGNLVDAGGAAKQLFVLTRIDPLRVYVQVPQRYAAQVKIGDKAELSLAELPGRTFSATVVRSSGVIGLQTRALQVEIRLPNPHGELLPGAYVQVVLHTAPDAAGAVLKVPGNTLLFRPEGPCVAVVGASGRVHLQVVSIARELGVEVELSGGVGEHDRLIINPPDSLAEGDQVEVTVAAEKVKPAG